MIRFRGIAIVFCLIILGCKPEADARSGLLTDTLTIISQETGERHKFKVELALTPEQSAKGLMERTNLEDDHGMLFWFDGKEEERSFWMKNTLIPLDLIFIRVDGTIHHIHENAIPHDLTPIRSKGAVAAVLEIKGGQAEKIGIKPGDRVKQRFFQ